MQTELQLKNADFRAEVHLSKVKELIEAQKMVSSSEDLRLHEVTTVAAGALDVAQWNFLEKQLHMDVQTAIVYRRSLSNVEIARHVAKREWLLDRVQAASTVVEMFCNPGADGSQHIYFMDVEDGPSEVLLELDNVQQRVASTQGLPGGQLLSFVWTNWVSTSLTKASSRAVHLSVIEAIIGQRDYQNLGVTAMPCHSYRASTWTAEVDSLKALGNAGVNLDRVVPLLFDPHTDRREERPNSFMLRVLTPLHCNKSSHFGPHGVWRDIPLARTNRVEGQLPSTRRTCSRWRTLVKMMCLPPPILKPTFPRLRSGTSSGLTHATVCWLCAPTTLKRWQGLMRWSLSCKVARPVT